MWCLGWFCCGRSRFGSVGELIRCLWFVVEEERGVFSLVFGWIRVGI